jgi:hypothetical protein
MENKTLLGPAPLWMQRPHLPKLEVPRDTEEECGCRTGSDLRQAVFKHQHVCEVRFLGKDNTTVQ